MARSRQYGEDLTYAEWHRHTLPHLYGRIGHRLDMANRDWTEFCHYCKTPLALIEEVRDVGQDLLDKGVSATRNLARMTQGAMRGAYLLAWRTERPREIDDEIDRLNRRIRELESRHPIASFTTWDLLARQRRLTQVTPDQWREHVLILHREHHQTCRRAQEFPVRTAKLLQAKDAHPLHELDLFDVLNSA